MAGIGMESAEEKELDERALPAEPSDNSSRPHRERRKPDRYGSLAPDGSISSKPKSLPHHSQAADPSPTTTAAAPALTWNTQIHSLKRRKIQQPRRERERKKKSPTIMPGPNRRPRSNQLNNQLHPQREG